MASLSRLPKPSTSSNTRPKRERIIDLSRDYPNDDEVEVQVLDSFPPPFPRIRKPFRGRPYISEPGQSSNSKPDDRDIIIPPFVCEICTDPKPYSDSFFIPGCTHRYCSECMVKYVGSKLEENICQIHCPVSGCEGLLEPENCRSILPQHVFDRWGKALCEAVIVVSEKLYCPYKDCSALMIHERGGNGEVITQSECPNCWRLFCAECKVEWHWGIVCSEFQKLNKDEREKEDIMLMNLAKAKKWMRCPKCKFYVDKSQGCLFMRCRCGYCFCYNCGAPLKGHYCSNCKR
ncbi:unnamed protein product [Ilex paraguariensis]|uniref:RBR-type E3 ubiquitin transferase n=1 Tax=Ilex paraguariensis TaxID=185542 RepID=A0ABC8R731_9AQUA